MKECKQCGSCCRNLPGFFEPGSNEVLAEVAKHLEISLEELKSKYLIKDYRAPFGKKIWFWTPLMVNQEGQALICSLEDYPQKAEQLGQEGGHCVFFSPATGYCLIHPVKPFSCRLYNCGEGNQSMNWIYFNYFGGEPAFPGEKIRINQEDWAACWDYCCPKCGQDEAAYTGVIEKEDLDYHQVVCDNCNYEFGVY